MNHVLKLSLLGGLLAAGGLLGGCQGPYPAPANAEFADLEDLEVPWYACLRDPTTGEKLNPTCEDPRPIAIRLDAFVHDPETGYGYNNVRVSFSSGYNDIFVLPAQAMPQLDYPDTQGWQNIPPEDVYADFQDDKGWEDTVGYGSTYAEVATDSQGVASVFVWVEGMPVDEAGQVGGAAIFISSGVETKRIKLTKAS